MRTPHAEGTNKMVETYNLEEELNLLVPTEVKFFHDRFDDLILESDGVSKPVLPARAFPLSSEDSFITLTDNEGNEIGTIRELAALDPDSRLSLEAELVRVYYTPKILQVNGLKENFHIPGWDVETDRGPRVFEIRSGRRDVRDLGKGRLLIRDADGNRYEIPNYHNLDPASRALVERVV